MSDDPYRLINEGESAEEYFTRLADNVEASRARIKALEAALHEILVCIDGRWFTAKHADTDVTDVVAGILPDRD